MQFTQQGLRDCLAIPRQVEVEERLGVRSWEDQPEQGTLPL